MQNIKFKKDDNAGEGEIVPIVVFLVCILLIVIKSLGWVKVVIFLFFVIVLLVIIVEYFSDKRKMDRKARRAGFKNHAEYRAHEEEVRGAEADVKARAQGYKDNADKEHQEWEKMESDARRRGFVDAFWETVWVGDEYDRQGTGEPYEKFAKRVLREREEQLSQRQQRSSGQHVASNQLLGKSPYEILGVSPSASKKEVKAAYRKVILECHPDRTAGLSEEIMKFATEQAKVVNNAYEAIMRERGCK